MRYRLPNSQLLSIQRKGNCFVIHAKINNDDYNNNNNNNNNMLIDVAISGDRNVINPVTTRRVHWTRSKILSCIILIITCPRQAVLNDFVKYSCCNIYISLG